MLSIPLCKTPRNLSQRSFLLTDFKQWQKEIKKWPVSSALCELSMVLQWLFSHFFRQQQVFVPGHYIRASWNCLDGSPAIIETGVVRAISVGTRQRWVSWSWFNTLQYPQINMVMANCCAIFQWHEAHLHLSRMFAVASLGFERIPEMHQEIKRLHHTGYVSKVGTANSHGISASCHHIMFSLKRPFLGYPPLTKPEMIQLSPHPGPPVPRTKWLAARISAIWIQPFRVKAFPH